jgi:hypothetical protein
VNAVPRDSSTIRTSHLAAEISRSRDEFGAKLVAQLKAQADEKNSKRKRKSTSVSIPAPIYETFKSAAKRQRTTMTALLLFSLEGVLSELCKLKPSTKATDNITVNERFAREIGSRLAGREGRNTEGSYFFPLRMPIRTHRLLQWAAVKYHSTMSRIVVIVLESVAPYRLTHSWDQYELFDKK